MATRTHDIVATVGEYKNNAGETKKRYTNVGSAFTDDQGRVSLKLDSIPVSPEWSGWLSLYPVKDREDRRNQPSGRPQRQSQPAADDDGNDDIPF